MNPREDLTISKEEWEEVWRKEKSIEDLFEIVEQEHFRITNILRFLPRGKILEAGCGDGKYAFYLEKLGYEVHAVDYANNVISRNKEISRKTELGDPSRFRVMDISELDYPSNHFDGDISMGVIEHFDDPRVPLKEAYRVLKENGIIFLTVPNKFSPNHITRYTFDKLKKDMMIWQREYSRWELEKLANSVGFETIKSFNCNVKDSLRCGLLLDTKLIGRFINPFFPLRGLIYSIARQEWHLSLIGYHSIFVGIK